VVSTKQATPPARWTIRRTIYLLRPISLGGSLPSGLISPHQREDRVNRSQWRYFDVYRSLRERLGTKDDPSPVVARHVVATQGENSGATTPPLRFFKGRGVRFPSKGNHSRKGYSVASQTPLRDPIAQHNTSAEDGRRTPLRHAGTYEAPRGPRGRPRSRDRPRAWCVTHFFGPLVYLRGPKKYPKTCMNRKA
jgi:hypothetical protein